MKDSELVLQEKETSALTSYNGSVARMFEGENILEYGFDLPETATATVEKDGALVKVSDEGASLVAVYFSFEGARKYTPAQYISNVIVPKVSAVTSKGTVTTGSHEWDVVESEWTVWHVAKSTDGKWLIVVESKKADSEKVNGILETFVTE